MCLRRGHWKPHAIILSTWRMLGIVLPLHTELPCPGMRYDWRADWSDFALPFGHLGRTWLDPFTNLREGRTAMIRSREPGSYPSARRRERSLGARYLGWIATLLASDRPATTPYYNSIITQTNSSIYNRYFGHGRHQKRLSGWEIRSIAGRGELQQIVCFDVQKPPLMMLYG